MSKYAFIELMLRPVKKYSSVSLGQKLFYDGKKLKLLKTEKDMQMSNILTCMWRSFCSLVPALSSFMTLPARHVCLVPLGRKIKGDEKKFDKKLWWVCALEEKSSSHKYLKFIVYNSIFQMRYLRSIHSLIMWIHTQELFHWTKLNKVCNSVD